jgi:hypothetical protein
VIRFAWLQFRTQAAIAVGALTVIAVVLAATGPNLAHLYDTTVANCASYHNCSTAATNFTNNDGAIQIFMDFLVLVAPLLIGMFWGAPLISREFEAGTFRLVWTQGVTRTRWLAVKLGLGALLSMAAAGLVTLMVTWWSARLDQVHADPFSTVHFGDRDIVPIGYTAFGFALGVSAGLLFHRLLPAILTVLIGFVAMREIVNAWVLPNLMSPFHTLLPITASTPVSVDQTAPGVVSAFESTRGVNIPNAWVHSVKIVDNAGHAPTTSFLNRACPLGTYGPVNPQNCTASLAAKFHQLVTYQPASHYWPMQWYELAIFLGLSIALGGCCFWWIDRPAT